MNSPESVVDAQRERAAAFLTAEHAALQAARAATIFEANGRVALYLGAVSSAVVALAFVGQAAGIGTVFFAFGAVLFPSLVVVGVVTFARVRQTGLEDFGYARRIERIRRFYVEQSPLAAAYLDPPRDDEVDMPVAVLGVRSGRWQLLLTTAGMVGVVNSVLAGACLGLLVAWATEPTLAVGAIAGGVAFALSQALYLRAQYGAWRNPSPDQIKDRGDA